MRTNPCTWQDACSIFLHKGFACPLSRPDVRIFLTLEPREKGNLSEGETSPGWGAVARWKVIYHVWFEAHLTCAGARLHSNNTAELSSMGPTALSLAFRKLVSANPSMLPALAWGLSNHARTSPGARQSTSPATSPVKVRSYFSEHIYSQVQNLGNDCADHAATLGANGASNQNMHTRWDSLFIRLHFFGCAM